MDDFIKAGIFATLFIALFSSVCAQADDLYFIDAHSQVDHRVSPLEKIIPIMRQGGVSHTILSARGQLKGHALLDFASQHPEYITPAVRTKGKHYAGGSTKYYKSLKGQTASGKYAAMAEILLYHAQKGSKAPEYAVHPEDKRVRSALSYAIENDWPFVIHIEFGALDGRQKKQLMQSMEAMLDGHSRHPFVLTHMGQLMPDECRRLIEHHKNIHFHTGWTNPAAVSRSNQPWSKLFKGQQIAPAWRELFIQYPQRFVFALDNVFAEHWSSFYLQQMEYWNNALAELPADVAHLIAHGNAERLWRLPEGD